MFDILVKGVYSLSVIKAKFGKSIRINFKREELTECFRFVNFSDFKIRCELLEVKIILILGLLRAEFAGLAMAFSSYRWH